MRIILILAIMTLSPLAHATELGYSLTHQRTHSDVGSTARGLEGRINFGGNSERYTGDRWSLAVGYMNSREPDDNVLGIDGYLVYITEIPEYWYASFSHRWYTKPMRFKRAPQLRLFIGTGVVYRDVETCAIDAWGTGEEFCWNGTAEVSTPWAFHQTAGIKWRERLEIAWEHDSTGGFSRINTGDDRIRFTLYATIGGNGL